MKVKKLSGVYNHQLTPPYARFLVHLIRPFPNFDFFFIKNLRQKAVKMLELKPGARVLDAGCGPGGCFPYLVDAVGLSGQVVGIEISPEITINARRRIEKNGWSNVQVITADARTVKLKGKFDGLLMFAAGDVYASLPALDNLFPHLKNNARICAFGAKLTHRRSGKLFNSFFRAMVSKLSFPSAPDFLNYEPWNLLENRVGKLTVEEYFFGCFFLAWGSINAGRKS
ncbi:MAG: methyltransferase domain-containing protein [candidate division Zixibacteria bacterium]|nr:methyltransferase domain-containing protein [candidate division Zixibacteria bacterium]